VALDVECPTCKVYQEWNDELRDEINLLRGKLYHLNESDAKPKEKSGQSIGGILTRRRRIHNLELKYQRLADANSRSASGSAKSDDSSDESTDSSDFAESTETTG
jgi:hypothetical protein